MNEIEAKIHLADQDRFLEGLKGVLRPLGQPMCLHDTYFDLPQLSFKSRDNVLRLRKQGNAIFIAYKGPRLDHRHLISRQEEETEIADYDIAYRIITGIGFEPIEIVEKMRQEFQYAPEEQLRVYLDKLPFIGSYLEVEGSEKPILAFLEKAGISLQETVRKNYTELFLEFCRSRNIHLDAPRLQFTFAEEALHNRSSGG